ncbi:hypothetical protein LY13_004002 [Prauserella aidingensis]|uniref:hypothetical protein n=1 Tax=Prauserella aidingensis TaxID=387890 RepID=UPI0020A34DCB|nr:hypothetical protein [Prauserella aidingensis]MCP2255228.1 hypothetical protein [Prauserella aidingensis]
MTELQTYRRGELTVHDGQRSAPTRTDQAVTWMGWHLAELAAVGLPLVLAVTVAWWLAGLSVLAGALWAAHEATRRKRSDKAEGRASQAVPSAEKSDANGEGIA